MPERCSGKVALVTGRGSGIGKATALVFAQQGAKVIVSDVSVDCGKEAISLIRNTARQATFIKTDITQTVEIENLICKTVEPYGQLDYAFNNGHSRRPVPDR